MVLKVGACLRMVLYCATAMVFYFCSIYLSYSLQVSLSYEKLHRNHHFVSFLNNNLVTGSEYAAHSYELNGTQNDFLSFPCTLNINHGKN